MNDRFFKRLVFKEETTKKIQKLLSKIDECRGYWSAFSSLSPQFLSNLKKSVIISSAGSSTRIEGSKLSDEQIEKMIRDSSIRKLSTRDKQEVNGYIELIKEVFSSYSSISFSEGTICQFHRITLKYSEKDVAHKGKYKTASNRVEMLDHQGKSLGIIFDPTPPYLVQKEMLELVEWTQKALKKKDEHPLLIIGNFIFEYLSIHPFKDGNGRTSRILTNLLLLQHGYEFVPYVSHEKIVEENKADYYIALRRASKNWKTANEDISEWILFFLEVLKIQGERAVRITTMEDVENFLSSNQILVWNCFLEGLEWSRKDLAEKTGVNIKTVEQILNKLLGMHKIKRIGAGRSTRYKILNQSKSSTE